MFRCEWGMIDIIFFFLFYIRNCINMVIYYFFNILCSMVFFMILYMILLYYLFKMYVYNLLLEKVVNILIFINLEVGELCMIIF